MQQTDATWGILGGGAALLGGILVFAFWLWMFIDCLVKERDNTQKLIWALVIFFLPCLGSLIYFFVRKLPRGRT